MTQPNINLDDIARALKSHKPELRQANDRGHAAVAMLLRIARQTPEVLFIIRAKHENDPWSGNIGFPGGRLNQGSETPKEAAERETIEELAFDLKSTLYLGQLDDLYGAIMPVLVSCFVYRVDDVPQFKLNHEIESSFWCPLTTLLDEKRHRHETFNYRGEERAHPAVELLSNQQPMLWGITYRLMLNFFSLCGQEFGTQGSLKINVN